MPARPSNHLIAAVPPAGRGAFLDDCERVELAFAQRLASPDQKMSHVYFPSTGFISLLAPLIDGAQLEVALVGDEGMLGATVLLGVDSAPLQAIVQGAGSGLRMGVGAFRAQLQAQPRLESAVKRYLYVQTVQLAQAAGCTRFHLLEARLARWLLMTGDRAHADHFHITHVFLSNMLGMRRAGVTEAATALQSRGLISYHRGQLVVLDRPGLQEAACSCYRADLSAYEQVMGWPQGPPMPAGGAGLVR